MSDRWKGSAYLGLWTGFLLTGAALYLLVYLVGHQVFRLLPDWYPFGWEMGATETVLDAFSLLSFGLVLLWWAYSGPKGLVLSLNSKPRKMAPHSDDPQPTIGFESVTMIVAVVTAVIAIFTLTHEAFKKEENKQCSKQAASEDAKAVSSPSINIVIDSYNSAPCPSPPATICHRRLRKQVQPCRQGSPVTQPSGGPTK